MKFKRFWPFILHHGDGFAEGYGGLLGIVPPALRITFGTQHLGTLNWSKLWGKQNQTLDSNNYANLNSFIFLRNKSTNISIFHAFFHSSRRRIVFVLDAFSFFFRKEKNFRRSKKELRKSLTHLGVGMVFQHKILRCLGWSMDSCIWAWVERNWARLCFTTFLTRNPLCNAIEEFGMKQFVHNPLDLFPVIFAKPFIT